MEGVCGFLPERDAYLHLVQSGWRVSESFMVVKVDTNAAVGEASY